MKKVTYLSIMLSSALLYACNNNTPQEKAEQAMERTEEKALDAAADAEKKSGDVSNKELEKTIYSNMAAANAAVAKIEMPQLSNDKAKALCSELGKSIINRINAKTNDDIINTQKEYLEDKTDVEKAFLDKAITASDKDLILKYGEDCLAAARGAS
ncbi:hypothetical protein [Sphingobacterium faecium]|uniref:hypothetical protein n=1 Tax=Sphingobacterium faecium TaxID=34087 RepID=UPI002468A7BD|nr:hypothetical protein [Sphingobacterium faecium]MDH5826810.1 hypothetical protein [Sphingobacterium faecium]